MKLLFALLLIAAGLWVFFWMNGAEFSWLP